MRDFILLSNLILFLLTWISIYIGLPWFKKTFPDKPNQRSSHKEIKPTGLGIIFVLYSSIGALLNGYFYFIPNFFLGILGFIDDKVNLTAKLRFSFQFIFVNYLVFNSKIFNFFFLEHSIFINIVFWFLSNLILIGIINFINFMDGIDGLVAGCMLFIVATSSFLNGVNFLYLLFPLLAFLFWNWSPAKVFMGDAGSTFLGGFIVISILGSKTYSDSVFIFFSCTPLLMDAFICLIRRLLNCQKIFQPHKLHLYQRLNQNGWSHASISTLYILATLIFSIACTLKSFTFLILALTLLLSFGYYLDRHHAKPFMVIN